MEARRILKMPEVSRKAFRTMRVRTLRAEAGTRGTCLHFGIFEILVLAKLPGEANKNLNEELEFEAIQSLHFLTRKLKISTRS